MIITIDIIHYDYLNVNSFFKKIRNFFETDNPQHTDKLC